MAGPSVIIFGATGAVGSSAARTAHSLGASVTLAVRDLKKPIPGLSAADEQAAGFKRVQADLSQPETLTAAARTSGAKHAFVYLLFTSQDAMREAMQALKDGGIELVVFLSSASVQGDIRKTNHFFIPAAHARVEVSLDEVFGKDGYIAVRPAYFNSNVTQWAQGFRDGEVKLAYPEVKYDYLAPEDIGRVAGHLVVSGLKATEGLPARNHVYLYGPKLLTQREAVGVFAKALGKEVKVTQCSSDEEVARMVASGVPEIVAKQLMKHIEEEWVDGAANMDESMMNPKTIEESRINMRKFVEKPVQLEEWAAAHKDILA